MARVTRCRSVCSGFQVIILLTLSVVVAARSSAALSASAIIQDG